jgi:hypothetical protein
MGIFVTFSAEELEEFEQRRKNATGAHAEPRPGRSSTTSNPSPPVSYEPIVGSGVFSAALRVPGERASDARPVSHGFRRWPYCTISAFGRVFDRGRRACK